MYTGKWSQYKNLALKRLPKPKPNCKELFFSFSICNFFIYRFSLYVPTPARAFEFLFLVGTQWMRLLLEQSVSQTLGEAMRRRRRLSL